MTIAHARSPAKRPTRRGPVGARLPRTAQRQRAVQEGRRRAQRAGPHRRHLLEAGVRQHRQARPARPDALDGPVHPARAGLRRHLDRRRQRRRPRGHVLHDAGALRRRRPDHRALRALGEISTEFGRDTADITDRENVQYHWIRIEDVPEIWQRLDEVGLQTTEACGDCPRVVLGSPLAGESLDEVLDPTWAVDEIVRRYIGKSGTLQPAAQVQDRDLGPAGRRPRGQRRRVHRRQPSRARSRPGPVGGRRPVDQPDAGAAGRRLGPAGGRARRLGGRHVDLPGLRLPATACEGAAEVPDQGLGHREIPPGSRGRIPRPQADRRASPRAGQAPDRPRRHAEAQERAQRRRGRADRGTGDRDHPVEGRRPRRGGRVRSGAVHPVPEAGHPRRRGRQARRTGRRPGRTRSAGAPVARGART